MATVTIGLPVYNGGKYLDKALASLSAQTFKDLEILISDNASTDDTPQIIAKWQKVNPQIKYYRQLENIGMVNNFDWVFNNASSQFFMLSAHDDLWSKDYVENLYKTMISHKNCRLCVPKVIKINPDDSESLVTPYYEKIDTSKDLKRIRLLLRWAQSGWFYGIFDKDSLIKANIATKKYGYAWGNEFITMLPFLLSGNVAGSNNAIYYQRQTGLSEEKYKPKSFQEQKKLYNAFFNEAMKALQQTPHSCLRKTLLIPAILKYTSSHAWKPRRLIKSFFRELLNI